jgi:hypothetical protein
LPRTLAKAVGIGGTSVVHVAETVSISILVSAIESFLSKYYGGKKPKRMFLEG